MTQLTRRNVLFLAVAMAMATTFVAYLFLNRQQVQALSSNNGPATQTMVVLARQEIRPLQLLRPEQFYVKQVKADGVPRDAVAAPADLKGKVALVTMNPGQVVTEGQVASKNADLGLAYTVKPPFRAVTVALDPIIGVAGFPKPGNHVDVLATFTTDAAGTVSRTVLQNVEILALGSDIQPKQVDPGNGKTAEAKPSTPTATLAVLPGEAEKLVLAENRGKLHLALRGAEDKTYIDRTMTKEVSVVGIAPPNRNGTTPVVTKQAKVPTEEEFAARGRAAAQGVINEFKRELPGYGQTPPSLPPLSSLPSGGSASFLPAPRPEHVHAITVIRGTEKQVVKFKKDGALKTDSSIDASE